jgi:hypothetical protein
MQAQLAMEKHPDFVVIKADIKNFYNEGDRDKALQDHAKGVRQGNINMGKDFKLIYHLCAQEPPIFGNNEQRMGFTSSMDGQQGTRCRQGHGAYTCEHRWTRSKNR